MYQLTVTLGIPSYGMAIIFMTVVIKLAMFPLTQKQLKSMRAMQELQPKIKYLQEKYKNDPQLMQTKTMELYKEHNASPFSGCLPLLIQMPIFIAFYQALFNFSFTNVAHASFLWIPNIGEPDPFFLIAALAALTTYLQQRISMVSSQDATQRAMLYIMPVMMGLIAFRLPAGLPLYWVVFNILGIVQQLYVNKIALSDKAKALARKKEEEESSSEAERAGTEEDGKTADAPKSGKGGKGKNGNPYGGKKGKKH